MTGLLNRSEAARLLGLSPQTLAVWAVEGKGPRFVKLGAGRVRYHPDELSRFIRDNTRGSTAEATSAADPNKGR